MKPETDDILRDHSFDGIQEYDKRLPNWWLFTLYAAIAFSVVYWACLHQWFAATNDPGKQLEEQLKANQMIAAKASGVLTDELLWSMSRDPKVTSAGKATFETTCATCHNPDLSGKIGPNLKDDVWIHGGQPLQIVNTITNGVPAKGMPVWGSVLGRTKISEAAAYILSYHTPPANTAKN